MSGSANVSAQQQQDWSTSSKPGSPVSMGVNLRPSLKAPSPTMVGEGDVIFSTSRSASSPTSPSSDNGRVFNRPRPVPGPGAAASPFGILGTLPKAVSRRQQPSRLGAPAAFGSSNVKAVSFRPSAPAPSLQAPAPSLQPQAPTSAYFASPEGAVQRAAAPLAPLPLPAAAYSLQDLEMGAVLGRGAFGEVSVATHRPTGEQVVVKRIKTDSIHELSAARREAEILKQLEPVCHPHILCYKGKIEDNVRNHTYIVTERIVGYVTLTDAIAATLPAPPAAQAKQLELWRLGRGLLFRNLITGLSLIHAEGVAHRDIKPDNILVQVSQSPDGRKWLTGAAKIIDFGLACKERQCGVSTIAGTASFMPPELGLHPNSPHSFDDLKQADIWALGCTIWQSVIGQILEHAWVATAGAFAPFIQPDLQIASPATIFGDAAPWVLLGFGGVRAKRLVALVAFWKQFQYGSALDMIAARNQLVENALRDISAVILDDQPSPGFDSRLTLTVMLDRDPARRRLPRLQLKPRPAAPAAAAAAAAPAAAAPAAAAAAVPAAAASVAIAVPQPAIAVSPQPAIAVPPGTAVAVSPPSAIGIQQSGVQEAGQTLPGQTFRSGGRHIGSFFRF